MADLSVFDLTGMKALVTGAGRGIGRSLAYALAGAGADVAVVGRDEATGRKVTASIHEMGRDAIFLQCDVTDPTQVQATVDAVVRRFGRLDIAVNNAGVILPALDEAQPKEDWDRVIDVNLTGTWLCAQAAMQQMIKQTPWGRPDRWRNEHGCGLPSRSGTSRGSGTCMVPSCSSPRPRPTTSPDRTSSSTVVTPSAPGSTRSSAPSLRGWTRPEKPRKRSRTWTPAESPTTTTG